MIFPGSGVYLALDFTMEFPGHRPFYKYVAPDTVLAILETKNVRYSSPLKFNDPFDHQVGLHLDFDLSSFPKRLIDKYEFLAKNPQIELADSNDSVAHLISYIREKYPTHGFPRGMFDQLVQPVLAAAAEVIEQTRSQFQDHWLRSLSGTRTFCVTEEPDNLLMWSHYARDHTGAVLELWSLPEEDNALSVALKVDYAKMPPSFFSEDEFIDDLCGIRRLDLPAMTKRSIHTKSDHWAYENEWRVYYPLSENPGLYDDVGLRRTEFKAIYFGCCAGGDFVDRARELLAANYPDTRQLAALKSTGRFEVQFSEI